MMTNSISNDFWFEFDNVFRFEPSGKVLSSYGNMGGLSFSLDLFNSTRKAGTYPKAFIAGFDDQKANAIKFLTDEQEAIFNKHFNGASAAADMQTAFVEFGQGLLTDERRNIPKFGHNVIHSMDGSAANPPIGYHRWHTTIRSYTLLNGIVDGLWLSIDRNLVLAWAIQSLLKPLGDSSDGVNPNTKSIDPGKLSELESKYLGMNFDQLDDAFDHFPYPES